MRGLQTFLARATWPKRSTPTVRTVNANFYTGIQPYIYMIKIEPKECNNSKIHISSNFVLSICLLIMLDTLLLRPSLHCNTSLQFTQYTSLPLSFLRACCYIYFPLPTHAHKTLSQFSFKTVHVKNVCDAY